MLHLERITQAESQGQWENRIRVEKGVEERNGKKKTLPARFICTMRGANEKSYVNTGPSVTHASVNEQMHCVIFKKRCWVFRCQFRTASAPSQMYSHSSHCHPHAEYAGSYSLSSEALFSARRLQKLLVQLHYLSDLHLPLTSLSARDLSVGYLNGPLQIYLLHRVRLFLL